MNDRARRRRLAIAVVAAGGFLLGVAAGHTPASAQCPGDCNADTVVTIDELVAAVGAALAGCPVAGGGGEGTVRTCGPRGIITEPEVFKPSPPARSIYPEVVARAGGAAALADRAAEQVAEGDLHRALHMADMALEADPQNVAALRAKRQAVERLFQSSVNLNELGWLKAAMLEIDARLPDAAVPAGGRGAAREER
jgi:hypothetical protein